jgi:hypothetical protein
MAIKKIKFSGSGSFVFYFLVRFVTINKVVIIIIIEKTIMNFFLFQVDFVFIYLFISKIFSCKIN